MYIRKVCLFLLTLVLLSGSLLPCVVHADSAVGGILPENCSKVAESSRLILYFGKDSNAIYVQNRKNGYIWSSDAASLNFAPDELNEYTRSIISALFEFKYTSTTNKKYAVITVNQAENKPQVSIKENGFGIDLLYKYNKLGLSITVKLKLEENSLTVQIPADMIKEEKEYKLVSLSILPYFGASLDSENGYVFYPDGSGALFRFKSEPRVNTSVSSFYIYGTDAMDIAEYKNNERKNIKTAMLPVYGIKKGDNAILGIITEGDFNAAVNFTPSGFANIALNRISTEFTCRRTFKDLRNDPDLPQRLEPDIINENRSLKICFLDGLQADYSGMADEYREYLLEEGRLADRIPDEKADIPLGLDIFMGIKEKRLLFDKYITATSFSQTETILEMFSEKGVENIQVNLIGWSKNGYGANPTFFEPSRRLGGIKGINKLSDFTKKKGYRLYLDANFVDADKSTKGLSFRNDMVHSKNGLLVMNKSGDEYLISPYSILKKFIAGFLPGAEKQGIDGISFDKFGSRLYHDYREKNDTSRIKTAQYWSEMLGAAAGKLGSSGSDGGNAYVLSYADRLFNIPVEDSGNLNTDEAVPFYQMVVHGFIPYSSEPGNLFYDARTQKLKWVEYGCMPYFKLTYSEADILKYTEYNSLFSSCYKDWIEPAASIYKEFNERLSGVWNKKMIRHEKINDKVFEVTYEDGTRVYINYSEFDITADSFDIKASDYLVVDREGNTR